MTGVFLSHSSRDNPTAAELKAWLDGQGFAPAFLDFDKHSGIPPGADWERTLYEQIQRCQALLILQTPNWSDSRWCFAEFTQARALGKPIFQLVQTDEAAAEKPIAADLQRLDLRHDRPAGLEQLRRELERIALQDQGGFPWPPPSDPSRSPFPGLMVFEEEDAPVFFGRDNDWRVVIERLNTRRVQGGPRLLVIQGSSGSGKSSLLRAGVLPRLRRAGRQWLVLPVLRPQAQPLESLAQTLALALQRPEAWRELHQQLLTTTAAPALAGLVAGWAADLRLAAAAPEAQLLLPIDQAEELFTVAEAAERERIVAVLAAMLQPAQRLQAVMTIRADAMGSLQSLPELVDSLDTLPLGPLSLERYREIIEGPARVAGLKVEPAFVERAIQDTATEDALPLLAFALRQLHERFGADGVLSLSDYQSLGDPAAGLSPLENAVKQAADGVLQALRPDEASQKALREAFVPAMVRVGEQGVYARRAAAWDSLPQAARPLLEALLAARLLVRRQGEGQPSTVEVAHEALLRVWPLLRDWLEESRDFLLGSQQLEQDLAQWQAASPADRPRALLSGLKLARGRAWLAERSEQLRPELRAFIQASQLRAERQERLLIGALVVLGVLSLSVGWQWKQAEARERVTRSVQLATASRASLDFDTTKSLVLAAIAMKTSPTPEAMSALGVAFNKNHEITYFNHGSSLIHGEFSPSNSTVALSIDSEGVVKFWKTSNGETLCTFGSRSRPVATAHFNPKNSSEALLTIKNSSAVLLSTRDCRPLMILRIDSSAILSSSYDRKNPNRIATIASDKSVQIWNTKKPHSPTHVLYGHIGDVWKVEFDPNNLNRILTLGSDATARIWDLQAPQTPIVLKGHQGQVLNGFFDPRDPKRVLTVGEDKTARVWNLSRPDKPVILEGHGREVFIGLFNPSHSDQVVTLSKDGKIRLWNLHSPKTPIILQSEIPEIISASFNEINLNQLLIVGGSDSIGMAEVWDIERLAKDYNLIGHQKAIQSGSFNPFEPSEILTASADGTARVWSIASKAIFESPRNSRIILSGTFHKSDSNKVSFITKDGILQIWQINKIHLDSSVHLPVRPDSILSAELNPLNNDEIITVDRVGQLKLYNAADMSRPIKNIFLRDRAVSASFSFHMPQKLLVVSETGVILIHEISKPMDNPAIISLLPSQITFGRFNPNNSSEVITASDDGSIRIWDLRALNRPIAEKEIDKQTFWFAGFSPVDKNTFFGSGNSKRLWIWQRNNKAAIHELSSQSGIMMHGGLSNSSPSRALAVGRGGTSNLWFLDSPHMPISYHEPGEEMVYGSFGPRQSNKFLTISNQGRLRVYLEPSNSLVDMAVRKLSRCLTFQEIKENRITTKELSAVFSSQPHDQIAQSNKPKSTRCIYKEPYS